MKQLDTALKVQNNSRVTTQNGPTFPLVSIIVTTYQRFKLAQRAICSSSAQTYSPLEIIVIEDGSSSGIKDWIEHSQTRMVAYFQSKSNKGLAASRNTGLKCASGKYVAFLDDDDEWFPEKLEKQVKLAENISQPVETVCCGVLSCDRHGAIQRGAICSGNIRKQISEIGLSVIPDNTGLYNRQALLDIKGYDEEIYSHTEYALWMKMADADFSATSINSPLAKIHVHDGTRISSDSKTRIRATDQFIEKWEPKWAQWYGSKRARELHSDFIKSALVSLGETCCASGRISEGIHSYISALRRTELQPLICWFVMLSAMRALLKNTPLYGLMRNCWRKARRIQIS